MKLKSAIWKVAKAGIIMFSVGVALAAAAPIIANLVGSEILGEAAFKQALNTPKLWTGLFFGAFGAIHEAIDPVENWLFNKAGSKLKGQHHEQAQAAELVVEKQPVIVAVIQSNHPERATFATRELQKRLSENKQEIAL